MAASIWAFVKASVESVPELNPFTWPDTVTCPAMVVAEGILDDDVLTKSEPSHAKRIRVPFGIATPDPDDVLTVTA